MGKSQKRVVIIGGGFAGLAAARNLSSDEFAVTLIDRNNYHLFQPLLYQVATGYLAPGDIAAPIRSVLAKQKNIQVIRDEVVDFQMQQREVVTRRGTYAFDILILATGVTHSYFGHQEWEERAPGLKSIEDAIEIRGRVLRAFEEAERVSDPTERKRNLSFVIVGGGPTGVELAGTLAELARGTLKGEFRNFDPKLVDIQLIEAGDRVLSSFHQSSSRYTESALKKLGVNVLTKTRVTSIDADTVTVQDEKGTHRIDTRTVLWAAGVAASPLAAILAERTGCELDRAGRVKVAPDLSLPQDSNIFVLGDVACVTSGNSEPLPGVAPVAIQQGQYLAKLLKKRAQGKATTPFRYFDKGIMAVIGKGRAIAESWKFRLTGFPAWLAWAFIHICFLIDFENKVVVFFHWAWNYITNQRGSRLITRG